jgi:predicted amidohydrolase YtcJ
MKRVFRYIVFLNMAVPGSRETVSPHAEILITNARVFTSDEKNPCAEAVAVKGNCIVFVGSAQEAAEWRGRTTRIVDGGGYTLMPGFIDSHFHMLDGSLALDDMHAEFATTYEEVIEVIQAFAAEHPERAWLTGFGLRYILGPNHTPLHRAHLDAVVADRPIFIVAYDGHTAWANTLALTMAGIFNGGECGLNSEIVLDENGRATGELREEGSQAKIEALIPKPDAAQKRRLLKKGLKLASSLGVTSIHNMDGDDEQAALYAAFEDTGDLTVRIYVPYSISPETPFAALEKEAVALKRKYQSDMVRGGCVKLFMDGVIESYTGLLVDEYTDLPGRRGASNYEVEHFNRMILEADRLGLQIFVHSVGDGGVRRVLDAYEAARRTTGPRDSRHRVEHVEVIHPDDVHRFAELGVIASMQPLHAPPRPDDGDVWPWRVGEARWPYSFAWTTLREAGARLVFGSDWPVVSQNPMLGVHNALNRITWKDGIPHHRQSLTEALLSYTREAAYAEFQESKKGQLKTGYLADMVLLAKDIFQIPINEMKDIKPLMTMVDGRIVFEA